MHPPSQLCLDFLQFGTHPVPPCFPLELKLARTVWLQICVNPRKSKVSGFPNPRLARLVATKRPNSIKRVLSGWSVNENFSSRSRSAIKNRWASSALSKPSTGRVAPGNPPEALTEPDVNVSAHPALPIEVCPHSNAQCANRCVSLMVFSSFCWVGDTRA